MEKVVLVKKEVVSEGNHSLEIYLLSEITNDMNYSHEFKELKRLNEMYENVLNSIDEAIVVIDKNGYFR